MKKIVLYIITAFLIVSLTACGSFSGQSAEKTTLTVPVKGKIISYDPDLGWNEYTYTFIHEGFTKRDDGIIQLHSRRKDDTMETLYMISFYTAGGKFIGQRNLFDYPDNVGSNKWIVNHSDYLDIADVQTIEGYLKVHLDIQKIESDTAYYEDGSYTKLTLKDGLIIGEDHYNSSDILLFHYRTGDIGRNEEMWCDYTSELNDFSIKTEITYDEIPVTFD